jgi:hypothetical protein
MKVKIDNKIYDAKDQPIMVILNKGGKQQIADMHPDATKYCQYSIGFTPEEIKDWMRT